MPKLARAPSVQVGTALAEDPGEAASFVAEVEAMDLDPRVFTGAFSTNVWGGRYEVDQVLARGGQGTTFSARDLKTDRRVAIKLFDMSTATEWKKVDLFEREVRTLKRLSHPAIPKFVDLIEDDDSGVKALVMTQVPGRSLGQHLQTEGPLLEGELWRVMLEITEVLGALHGQSSPVIHRDVKPDNLIRRPDGVIALVDFGGVGTVRGAKGSTVVGTFGYMAPEQLYGNSTTATDIYALGATLLTLATGLEPEDQPRKGLAIDVDKAAPHLSPALRALIARLLSPEPGGRPHDAKELQKELSTIAAASPKDGKRKKEKKPKRAKRPKRDKGRAESAETDPSWPEPKEEGIEEAGMVVGGILSLVVGILGTVGLVVVGEVMLPLLLTLISAFATGSTRKKLQAASQQIRETSQAGRKGFAGAINRGVGTLKEVDHRDKRRRALGRRSGRGR